MTPSDSPAEAVRRGTHARWYKEPGERYLTFSGRIDLYDLAALRLDGMDAMVLREPILSAADLFQTLEIVFRRMAEQADPPTPVQEA